MCDRSLRRRLMELGIVPGSQVEIIETKIGHIVKVLGVTYALQKDAGMESNTGQNKNFIVSPDYENGALLGKHMMHNAGKVASRQMRKAGIQMIMQESAVKQRGERQFNKVYDDLSPEHIKFNYSVIQNENW